MSDKAHIEALKVHNFQPGDLLIVKVDPENHVSEAEIEGIRVNLKKVLPEGVKYFLSYGMEYELLRKGHYKAGPPTPPPSRLIKEGDEKPLPTPTPSKGMTTSSPTGLAGKGGGILALIVLSAVVLFFIVGLIAGKG